MWKPTKEQEAVITSAIYVALQDARMSPHTWNPDTVEFVARRIAGALGNSHTGFNAGAFLDSCGVESESFVRDPEAWQAVAAEGRKYR